MRYAASLQGTASRRLAPWVPSLIGFVLMMLTTWADLSASGARQRLAVLRPLSRTAHRGLVAAIHARLTSSLASKSELVLVDQKRVDVLWQRKWNRSSALEDLVALGREVWAEQVLISWVEQTRRGYQAWFTTVHVDHEGIIAEERVEADTERELLEEVRLAAERVYSNRNELFAYPDKFAFLSLFVPGKAQWFYGSKVKGAVLFAGIAGLFATSVLLPKGDQYFGVGDLSIRAEQSAADFHYFIGTLEVAREEFVAEARRRQRARESRQRASRRKRVLRYGGLTLHAINVVDAFLLGRRYQKERLRRLTLRLNADPISPSGADSFRVTLSLQTRF